MTDITIKRWTPFFEVWLSWRFIRTDIWTTVSPLTLFSFGLNVATNQPPSLIIANTIIACSYFFLFIYVFEINSQIFGVEEDRINKPERPLPAGVITLKQGKKRAVIISASFIAYAFLLNVELWALLWFGLVWLYSYTGCSRHWLLKCLFVSIGTLTQLSAAAIISGVPLLDIWVWLLSIFIMVTLLIGVQDFRDVEGDRRVGRVTLPIRVSVRRARLSIAQACLVCILIAHFTIFNRPPGTPLSMASQGFELTSAALLLWIFIRMFRRKPSRDHDHLSYRLLEYWFTVICASVITYSF